MKSRSNAKLDAVVRPFADECIQWIETHATKNNLDARQVARRLADMVVKATKEERLKFLLRAGTGEGGTGRRART